MPSSPIHMSKSSFYTVDIYICCAFSRYLNYITIEDSIKISISILNENKVHRFVYISVSFGCHTYSSANICFS